MGTKRVHSVVQTLKRVTWSLTNPLTLNRSTNASKFTDRSAFSKIKYKQVRKYVHGVKIAALSPEVDL
jgi:hypothetical protein